MSDYDDYGYCGDYCGGYCGGYCDAGNDTSVSNFCREDYIADDVAHIQEVLARLGYEEVGRFPFRRIITSDSMADVDSYIIAWAKKGSGLLVQVDTWQWSHLDHQGANGLWVHGLVNPEVYRNLRVDPGFGNNGPINSMEGYRAFHCDCRSGLEQFLTAVEPVAERQWAADERNTDWILCSHGHEFEAYNVSQGKPAENRLLQNSMSHFDEQCHYTEAQSMAREVQLPDWVQEFMNTKAYHEHYTAQQAARKARRD